VFVAFAIALLGGGAWSGLPLLLLLVLVPTLDLLTGWQDNCHFQARDFGELELAVLRWNPRIYAILNLAVVLYLALRAATFTRIELGLLLASASVTSAVGFAAAHELLHGQRRSDQLLERVLTSFLFYPHYKLIHIYGHHVHVATPTDENTAWHGESIYGYLMRTIPGSALRCWQLERERASRGGRRTGLRLLGNRMLVYAMTQLGLVAAVYSLARAPGLIFYLAHLAGAHVMLEAVNYLQHYGLLRGEVPGRAGYERTAPEHAWDSYHFFSSFMTFRVGHHANHHVSAGPYYLLSPEPDAPKLPLGYFWAIALVLLPPAWWLVIHPRLSGDPATSDL
jgi:alkane 1-monooxygenase